MERGLAGVLCDIRSMAKARHPQARRKYFHLLKAIAALDLMTLPPEFEGKNYDHPRGVYECIDRIGIPSALPDIEVIHVLPETVEGMDCINFETFAGVVEDRGQIGRRFATSLRNWVSVETGDRYLDSPAAG